MRRIEFVDGARLVRIDGHINPEGRRSQLDWRFGVKASGAKREKPRGRRSKCESVKSSIQNAQCSMLNVQRSTFNVQLRKLSRAGVQRPTSNVQRGITQFFAALITGGRKTILLLTPRFSEVAGASQGWQTALAVNDACVGVSHPAKAGC